MSTPTLREELASKGFTPEQIKIALTAIRERLPKEEEIEEEYTYAYGYNTAIREMRERIQ